MQTLIKTCLIAITTICFAQTKNVSGEIEMENIKTEGMSVSVTVDSALDIERTFKTEDIAQLFKMLSKDQDVSFEMICKTKTLKNGVSKSVTYRARGNSDKKEVFIASVVNIRNAAIKYYDLKQ